MQRSLQDSPLSLFMGFGCAIVGFLLLICLLYPSSATFSNNPIATSTESAS